MKFKIDVPIQPNPLLNYQIPVLALGSCFADRIATKLIDSRFDVLANPFGVLYNPVSISTCFLYSKDDVKHNLIEANGVWHSWNHHGSFSSPQKSTLIDKMNAVNQQIKNHLEQPKINTLITLGSAWVYSYKNQIVANCHKLPGSKFTKRLLSVAEVVDSLSQVVRAYPQHNFVFTLSPIRYIKEGVHNSNLSKSVLHLAVNEIVTTFSNCHYFPAYEIVIDELRDYRFYDNDLLHPNDLAVDYVWEQFENSFVDDTSKSMIESWRKIQNMRNHKLLHPDTDEAKAFVLKLQEKTAQFEVEYF